jgi:hypothetical protein
MASVGDGFKDIFLAGIGAMALGAEKSKELVNQLIAKGELTVEQGSQINSELVDEVQKATEEGTTQAREAAEHLSEQAQTAHELLKEQGESVVSTARSHAENAAHAAKENSEAFATALKHDVLEAQMAAMTPEQRAEFAAKAAEIAARDK